MNASTTWHKHHLKNTMAEIAALPSQHPKRRAFFADVVRESRWVNWHSDNHNNAVVNPCHVMDIQAQLLRLKFDRQVSDSSKAWLEFMMAN